MPDEDDFEFVAPDLALIASQARDAVAPTVLRSYTTEGVVENRSDPRYNESNFRKHEILLSTIISQENPAGLLLSSICTVLNKVSSFRVSLSMALTGFIEGGWSSDLITPDAAKAFNAAYVFQLANNKQDIRVCYRGGRHAMRNTETRIIPQVCLRVNAENFSELFSAATLLLRNRAIKMFFIRADLSQVMSLIQATGLNAEQVSEFVKVYHV